jgi:hypothetical protein
MSDLAVDFLPFYLLLVIAAIAATPVLISARVHMSSSRVIAVAALATAAVTLLFTIISFLIGWLPLREGLPLLVFPVLPNAIAGALLGTATLLPLLAKSPGSRGILRVVLWVLALVPLLCAGLLAVMPIAAPMPP